MNLNTQTLIWTMAIVGIIILVGFFIWKKQSSNDDNPKALNGAVSRILRGYCVLRDTQVVSNVNLQYQNQTIHIDHMMIGAFGILLIGNLYSKGEVYGSLTDKKLVVSKDKVKKYIENPYAKQLEHTEFLRNYFAKSKIYRVIFESIVVYTGNEKNTPIFFDHEQKIVRLSALKAYINKVKFEKNNGVEVQKVIDAIEQIKI
ncbi:MAG: nuclease-related domain-containing protein [Oscillospiraceae bacterium]